MPRYKYSRRTGTFDALGQRLTNRLVHILERALGGVVCAEGTRGGECADAAGEELLRPKHDCVYKRGGVFLGVDAGSYRYLLSCDGSI